MHAGVSVYVTTDNRFQPLEGAVIDFNSALWTQIGQAKREENYGAWYSALVRPPVPKNAKFVALVNPRKDYYLRLDEVQIYQQKGKKQV